MCPRDAERAALDEAAAEAEEIVDEVEEPPPPPADPLGAFATELAQRQAAERGDGEGVDTAFISRALAESQRMRGAAQRDKAKRAALAASVSAQHGDAGLEAMHAAMREHAQEVLPPPQATEEVAPSES